MKTKQNVLTINFFKNVHSLYLILLVIFCISCSENEVSLEDASFENQNRIIQKGHTKNLLSDLILEMKLLGDQNESIIVFETKNIMSSNPLEHFKILDISKKAYLFNSGNSKAFFGPDDDYTVTCSYSDGETVVTECGNDVLCAGNATWDCTESGGCATVCNAKITYIPASYKLKQKKLENIDLVLREVENISKGNNNESLNVTLNYNGSEFSIKSTSILNTSSNLKKSNRAWQVDCFNSDGDLIWSETFEDRLDASQAILNCTDHDGGCANVCEIIGVKFLNNAKNKF